MGIYVNPSDMTKEDWLRTNATPISKQAAAEFQFGGDSLPVCLVNNGPFTAAGVAYDGRERDAFLAPDSGMQRPKQWFVAKIEALKTVTPVSYHPMMEG